MRAFTALLLCALLSGCERVVALDLPEGPKQLVVEARIERVSNFTSPPSGAQRVRLTTTDSYFSSSAPPPARGATVRVNDNVGGTTVFTESTTEPGVYVTSSLLGVIGRTYTLQIDWQGERYEATETLLPVAGIAGLYFSERSGQSGPSEGLRANIGFRDPAGAPNYYLWDQYVDGVRLLGPTAGSKARVVARDGGSDGQFVDFQPYDGIPVVSGAQVLIRQMGLSEPMYRYYVALSEQSANDGSPFNVPLSSVRSNIANRTNSAHRPLGYFMATEVSERSAQVP